MSSMNSPLYISPCGASHQTSSQQPLVSFNWYWWRGLVESWFSVGLSSVLVSSGALDQVLVESWFQPWRGDKSRALLGLGPGEETSPGLGFEYVMGGSQGTGLGPITGISSTGHVWLSQWYLGSFQMTSQLKHIYIQMEEAVKIPATHTRIIRQSSLIPAKTGCLYTQTVTAHLNWNI